ncbi:Putative cell division cycle 123 protein [Orpheovirus IHUMI-LCC2]|uniref:Cell division cycle 123 protein n=1 Tax=Orpheovirus IHUMI-LCC2 TaxID=2023057 RepID=A0A2I2L320_9VIRU|nr:Putative cell division cycle 123 protein [Orpheovirus IHUMI-LCC2]SNW61932.1 Putative cell division cycle 123 protein [Orpheovirus IHUMI-LCC2]
MSLQDNNYQWKDICMNNAEEYRCQMYSKYHSDVWYPLLEEMSDEDKYFTMKSIFLPYDINLSHEQSVPYNPYFIRLNSMSPKYRNPVYNVYEAYKIINESERTTCTRRDHDHVELHLIFDEMKYIIM